MCNEDPKTQKKDLSNEDIDEWMIASVVKRDSFKNTGCFEVMLRPSDRNIL